MLQAMSRHGTARPKSILKAKRIHTTRTTCSAALAHAVVRKSLACPAFHNLRSLKAPVAPGQNLAEAKPRREESKWESRASCRTERLVRGSYGEHHMIVEASLSLRGLRSGSLLCLQGRLTLFAYRLATQAPVYISESACRKATPRMIGSLVIVGESPIVVKFSH